MKISREDIIRETALIQRGLTRISKTPYNILNYFSLGVAIIFIVVIVEKEVFNSKGLAVLAGLTVCNFAFIFLYSFAYFSRIISEEKESQTMTLLRLAPVKKTNIFFGKLLPPYINLLQMLIFQIPIVMFMITLGGVSIEQILKVYTLLILTASCFAVIGAWVSSSNPENWLAYFNFLFMSFLLALIYGGIQMMRYNGLKEVAKFLNKENPFYKCYEIIRFPGRADVSMTVYGCFIFILGGLLIAYRYFIKHLDSEPINPNKAKSETRSRTVDFSKRPLVQKEYHFGCGGKTSQFLIIGLLTAVGTLFYFAEKRPYVEYEVPAVITNIALIQFSCIAVFLIYSVGNSFKKERIDSTWESLIVTPLSAKQIIIQKIMGSIKFLSPITGLIFIFSLFSLKTWERDFEYISNHFEILWVVPFFYLAILFAFIFTQLDDSKLSKVILISAGVVITISAMVIEHNKGDVLLICFINAIMLVMAYVFYRSSVKTIEKQINLQS